MKIDIWLNDKIIFEFRDVCHDKLQHFLQTLFILAHKLKCFGFYAFANICKVLLFILLFDEVWSSHQIHPEVSSCSQSAFHLPLLSARQSFPHWKFRVFQCPDRLGGWNPCRWSKVPECHRPSLESRRSQNWFPPDSWASDFLELNSVWLRALPRHRAIEFSQLED